MIEPGDAPRFTLEELQAVEPPDTRPEDFEGFWGETYRRARSTDLEPHTRLIWSPHPSIEVFEVEYTSWAGVRIGGWLTRPRRSHGGIVVGHGYGGRAWCEMEYALEGYTAIFPCIRGFHRSSHPSIPWLSSQHVVHEIDSRDTYVLRGSTADVWLAASCLIELYPDCADRLYYEGGSFGGGLGALALPWDGRFRAAHLEVPTFGHHPKRLRIPSTGSAEAVRQRWLSDPSIGATLSYYDAATAAEGISIPVLCSPALFDPAVTPPGQFAVANALRNGTLFVQPAGHFEYPELEETKARLRQEALEFFEHH